MGSSDADDLAPFLKRLMDRSYRATQAGRQKLANDHTTRAFLHSGLQLIVNGLGLDGEPPEDDEASEKFLDWISVNDVVRKARQDGKSLSKGMFRERWPAREDYIVDLISYIMWASNWAWQQDILKESGEVLATGNDLVEAIRIVCYNNLRSLINDPAQRLAPIATALVSQDSSARENRAKHYAEIRRQWVETFEAAFELYQIQLRPGIDIGDAADILTCLADGLGLRATGDPNATVIDHERKQSLLGRAALMLLVSAVDPGDGLTLEQVVRQEINK